MVLAGGGEGVSEGETEALRGGTLCGVTGDGQALEEGEEPGGGHHEERKDGEWEQEETPGLEGGLGDEDPEPATGGPGLIHATADMGTESGAEGGLPGLHDQVKEGEEEGAGTEASVGIGAPGHVGPIPQEAEDEGGGGELMEEVGGQGDFAEQMDGGLDQVEGRLVAALASGAFHHGPTSTLSAARPSCHSVGVWRRIQPRK